MSKDSSRLLFTVQSGGRDDKVKPSGDTEAENQDEGGTHPSILSKSLHPDSDYLHHISDSQPFSRIGIADTQSIRHADGQRGRAPQRCDNFFEFRVEAYTNSFSKSEYLLRYYRITEYENTAFESGLV